MSERTRDTWDEPGDDGVLDDADTLASDDMRGDRLDDGVDAGDRYSAGQGWGTTEAEARQGKPLDQRLAEEDPDQPDGDGEGPEGPEGSEGSEGSTPADEDTEADPYAEVEAEAGRLVADDEGSGADRTAEAVAAEVREDSGGRSAEEAAMRVHPEDDQP